MRKLTNYSSRNRNTIFTAWKKQTYLFGAILTLGLASSCVDNNLGTDTYVYDGTSKDASDSTVAKQDSIQNYLNFESKSDSIAVHRGFMGTLDDRFIYSDQNEDIVVYDLEAYKFLKFHNAKNAPNETNPSLWRQSKLNAVHGLFHVSDNTIYQIRGFDLANMSLIKGETGWIVIDPLGSPETARAGLKLANDLVKPANTGVSAVIFTHSHLDHFGGIEGVMESAINVDIPIYVPEGFYEEAISENVMGGNTMGRRASYMYGNVLTKDAKGSLGTGLGQTTATGMSGLRDGTVIIDANSTTDTIDGISMEFIYTPEAEAPAEMMFYMPDLNAFCQAEEINHTMHNLYTLRGAKVRNGQKWSQYIDQVIQNWGDSVKVSFGSHHWPAWRNHNINRLWENQRDLYRFLHDQSLRLANKGFNPVEIAEMMKLPKSIDTVFANRGYYGSVSHNARAQYQLYFGWFDGNPANLNKLPPTVAGKKYVKFMGGKEELLKNATISYNDGEYRWTAEVMNHFVFAYPEDTKARYLLADTYEQLGYQAESGPWRNFYLSGARDLRAKDDPINDTTLSSLTTASPAMIEGMSNELLFNYFAMRFDGLSDGAADQKYNLQFVFDDLKIKRGKNVALLVQNGVVTPRIDHLLDDSDIAQKITMSRDTLNLILLDPKVTFENAGGIIIETPIENGNDNAFGDFKSRLDDFEFWFNIVKSNENLYEE